MIDPDKLPAAAVEVVAGNYTHMKSPDPIWVKHERFARADVAAFLNALVADDEAIKRAIKGWGGGAGWSLETRMSQMRAALTASVQEEK